MKHQLSMELRDDLRRLPGSSGYMFRCHGIVGSTNGLGVCLSMNNGRLMATFDPRLRRMFAVKVLRNIDTLSCGQEGFEGID